MGWIFLLTMLHNDQGLIQLRRYWVTVRAASQISCMCTKDFQFNCKLTLKSVAGFYKRKYLSLVLGACHVYAVVQVVVSTFYFTRTICFFRVSLWLFPALVTCHLHLCASLPLLHPTHHYHQVPLPTHEDEQLNFVLSGCLFPYKREIGRSNVWSSKTETSQTRDMLLCFLKSVWNRFTKSEVALKNSLEKQK